MASEEAVELALLPNMLGLSKLSNEDNNREFSVRMKAAENERLFTPKN